MPTRAELRTIVRQDELLNSTDVISDANLNLLLGEGAVQFSRDGHAFIITASWSAVASTQEYVLSGASPQISNFLDIYWPTGGIQYTQSSGNVKTPPGDFQLVSELWLNREIPGWRNTSASDSLQYVYLTYDSAGNLSLGVYPKSSTTTPSFKLLFLSRGTDMSADANYPYLNTTTNMTHLEVFHKGIAYWAMYILHRDKTKLSDDADKYLQLYSGIAEQCREAQRRLLMAEGVGLREAGRSVASQTFGSL